MNSPEQNKMDTATNPAAKYVHSWKSILVFGIVLPIIMICGGVFIAGYIILCIAALTIAIVFCIVFTVWDKIDSMIYSRSLDKMMKKLKKAENDR